MTEPIPAKLIPVEQPVVPPCDLLCAVWLHSGSWGGRIIARKHEKVAYAEIEAAQKQGLPALLFHLSDTPVAAPLAVDAGVREGLEKEFDKLYQYAYDISAQLADRDLGNIFPRDHACSSCMKGYGDAPLVIAGFKCARHGLADSLLEIHHLRSLKHGGVA